MEKKKLHAHFKKKKKYRDLDCGDASGRSSVVGVYALHLKDAIHALKKKALVRLFGCSRRRRVTSDVLRVGMNGDRLIRLRILWEGHPSGLTKGEK